MNSSSVPNRKASLMWRSPIAFVLAAVLLTAGCTASGGKASPPPATASGQSSTTPSPASSGPASSGPASSGPVISGPNVRPGEKPPVFPAEAKQHTSEGALMFAGYFVKALDWSLATTDPALLKPISAPTCQACHSYIDAIGTLAAGGGHVVGGRIHSSGLMLENPSSRISNSVVVSETSTQQAVVLIRPGASPSSVAPSAQTSTSQLRLSWVIDRWLLAEETS
jgi:Family of unknown function (DUF6318)